MGNTTETKEKKKEVKERAYCFTSFKDGEPTYGDGIRYLVYQRECCPDTRREHWQGYVEFDRPTRISAAKKLLGSDSIHFEKRKGTREQARDYCRKDESRIAGPFEHGDWDRGGAGTRNDLKDAITVLEGRGIRGVVEEHPDVFVKFHRGLRELEMMRTPKRDWKTIVTWIHGPSGSGKSRLAREEAGIDAYWKVAGDNKWFDGYSNDEHVVIDDFKGGIPFGLLLNLMDRYPCIVETKGGTMQWVCKKLWITSLDPPSMYVPPGESETQIIRRVDIIKKLEESN